MEEHGGREGSGWMAISEVPEPQSIRFRSGASYACLRVLRWHHYPRAACVLIQLQADSMMSYRLWRVGCQPSPAAFSQPWPHWVQPQSPAVRAMTTTRMKMNDDLNADDHRVAIWCNLLCVILSFPYEHYVLLG